MKKIFLLFLIALCLSFSKQSDSKATGLLFTNATYPVAVTGVQNTDLSSLKKGSSRTTNILYLFEIGDAGIDKSAKIAGIKKISYVDINEKSVLIFWRSLTINVYGE